MNSQKRDYLLLAVLTVAALFVHGYHFGAEDQAIYLPAIRKLLDPSLYPHDSELFLPQTSATLFGNLIALTVRNTHLSCAAVLFIFVADVDWLAAGLIAVGSTIGGFLGARYGRKLPPIALRVLIVCIGILAIVTMVF